MRMLFSAAAMVVLVCPVILAQTAPALLTADQIMARVVANQDRSEAARTHYVYLQHIRAVSRKTNGKVMCEEITESRVSPRAMDSHQDLLKLDGRVWEKDHYVHYTTPQNAPNNIPNKDKDAKDSQPKQVKSEQEDLDGMDVDLVENLRSNLTNDNDKESTEQGHVRVDLAGQESSKDGLAKGLFPLTSKQQPQYLFKLVGRERMNGRDVYHVSFRPKDKNGFDWKGEAFIDTQEFEPVVVYTQMSRKIPLAVRTMLGTNLPGLGFSVTYARQPDGVWFPVSFGTEFRMRVLFFIARDISMSLENTHFEKTHSDVRILNDVKMVENTTPPAH